jgi:biopolymer transport protein ExbD
MSDKCGTPRRILRVEAGGELRFEPPADVDYDKAACLLNEIKASGVTKFGFVGNEKYAAPGPTDAPSH